MALFQIRRGENINTVALYLIRAASHTYRTRCWELIIKHAHNIHFGIRDSSTYVIFAIDIKGNSVLSL